MIWLTILTYNDFILMQNVVFSYIFSKRWYTITIVLTKIYLKKRSGKKHNNEFKTVFQIKIEQVWHCKFMEIPGPF